MPTLAYIGLGNMGSGMAKNLVEKGNLSSPLILYNRTTKKAEELSKELGTDKTKVAWTIEDAVRDADIIYTCLGNDKAVSDTIASVLNVDVAGKIFVECSTVSPDTTNAAAKSVEVKGASFVASPIWGPPAAAIAGKLIFILAGPSAAVAKVKPYTTGVMGRETIEYPDAEPGKASVMKLMGNTFVINMIEGLAQALTMAEKSGLGTENVLKFVDLFFPESPYGPYARRMVEGTYFKQAPLFSVDGAIKDCTHALSIAEKSGAKMPGVEMAVKHLKAVKEHQGESGDIAGVYGAIRKDSGLPFNSDGSG